MSQTQTRTEAPVIWVNKVAHEISTPQNTQTHMAITIKSTQASHNKQSTTTPTESENHSKQDKAGAENHNEEDNTEPENHNKEDSTESRPQNPDNPHSTEDLTRNENRKKNKGRKISMKEILPLYVNRLLPPGSTATPYPLVSYERCHGPGYLYVLSETGQGSTGELYKVGVTNDLKIRLHELQSGNPRPLVPVRLMKVRNMESISTFLNTHLSSLSVGPSGGKDWYRCEDRGGKNALLEIVDLVKTKVHALEIPPDQFSDYVHYFIKLNEYNV